jgi:3-oxoadipate enol-lactonase
MLIQDGFAPIDGAKMYFETSGRGRPLVMLHAGIADHRMWSDNLAELSRHFHVIAPDLRGYGKTPPPSHRFRHCEDIREVIRYFGFGSVNIVGSSVGGKTAIEFAIRYPDLVDGLILVAPGLPGYEFQDSRTLEMDSILEQLISEERREAVADILVDLWVVGSGRERESVGRHARSLVHQMILDNYDSVADKYPEEPVGFDILSCLGDIDAPTLVLIGENDVPDMVAISRIVADRIPSATRQLIPDAGHLPNLDHRAFFEQTVISFLSPL